MENGAVLGWLINPQSHQVEVYRQGCPKEVLNAPIQISGEDVLLGFILKLEDIL